MTSVSVDILFPSNHNKGHANFYECCDLTKKVYLILIVARKPELPKNTSGNSGTYSIHY